MNDINSNPGENHLWAYAYEIVPSQTAERVLAIQALLDEEHLNATGEGRRWGGRVVIDQEVTHVLVVSDSPDQKLEVNRRLEGELEKIEARFAITLPMAIGDDGELPPVMKLMD